MFQSTIIFSFFFILNLICLYYHNNTFESCVYAVHISILNRNFRVHKKQKQKVKFTNSCILQLSIKYFNILFQNMSFYMLSLIIILPYVLALYQVTHVSRNMYASNQIIDFGYHWVAYTYNNGDINFTDWNGETVVGQVNSGAIAMDVQVDILTNLRRILIITYPDNNLYFYEGENISVKDPPISSIQNAVFISENYVVAITTSQQLIKINYQTMVQQKIYRDGFKYNDSYLLAGIDTKIGVLSQGLLNTTLTVLNQNLIIMNLIQLSEEGGERELRYDLGSGFFVRCALNSVQVYDSSLNLIKQFNMPQLKRVCGIPVNNFYLIYSAVICNNVILINIFDRIVIFQRKNWTSVACLNLSTFSITNYTRLNCYPQNLMFSVAFVDVNNNQIIQQFSINDTYVQPPLINHSNLNLTLNNTNVNNFVQVLSRFINSSQAKNIASSTFSVIGFCATSPLTQNFVKPFLSLLTDLWFYGYHSTKYTEFIQMFTNQVDIWNELRIKPEIFNGVVIPKNEKENQLYNSTSHLHMRARKTIFMLLSIQDIYLFNISICLAQWIVNIMLKYFFRSLSQKCNVLERVYKKMLINSLWWSFLMAFMQPNIAQITFYGFIQMKDFYCFNFFSKINITISTLLVFIVLFYSFSFFPILKRLDEQQITRYAFEISKRRARTSGVFLETFLRGFRSFSQALIHVVLINNNQSQLMGLVLLDLSFIGLLIRYRQYFKRKIMFFFNLLYYLSFLSFDLMLVLFVYSETMNLDYASQEMQKYEFASMVIILTITGTIFLKTLSEILKSIFNSVKFMVKKLRQRRLLQIKIYDPREIQNKVNNQKSLKKIGKKRRQQKKINQFITNNYIKSRNSTKPRQQQTNPNPNTNRNTSNMVKIHVIRNGEVIN